MTVVIDASVAVKWVLRELGSEAADALLDSDDLTAPAIWLAEAANALWRRMLLGEITADEATERLNALQDAPLASVAIDAYLGHALSLAIEFSHPIYDCLYLALAMRIDTYVITADRRFFARVSVSTVAERLRLLGT